MSALQSSKGISRHFRAAGTMPHYVPLPALTSASAPALICCFAKRDIDTIVYRKEPD